MHGEATGKNGITIGGQQYALQPRNEHTLSKLARFIAFSRAVDKAVAPANFAAWKSQATSIAQEVKDANAPGFCPGGYHHLWMERLTRKMNMALRAPEAM